MSRTLGGSPRWLEPCGNARFGAALWQQRCLEVASRLHHVWVVDETRRTYRHHGRQRDAPRRIATLHHATLRVAPQRLSRWGNLAARARLARRVPFGRD